MEMLSLLQQLSESAKCKNLVHYNHNYHEIMQEMFKSERSKVKFAQILVGPWPDLKACSYTPVLSHFNTI